VVVEGVVVSLVLARVVVLTSVVVLGVSVGVDWLVTFPLPVVAWAGSDSRREG
jgi:hypothetical protein